MLDIDKINQEIEKLEQCDNTTWSICNKLATLYIVKDHYRSNSVVRAAAANHVASETNGKI